VTVNRPLSQTFAGIYKDEDLVDGGRTTNTPRARTNNEGRSTAPRDLHWGSLKEEETTSEGQTGGDYYKEH